MHDAFGGLKVAALVAAALGAAAVLLPNWRSSAQHRRRRSTLDRLERAAEAQRPVRIVVRDATGRRFIDGAHLVGVRPTSDGRTSIEYIAIDGRSALVDAADVIAIAEM